MTAADGEGVAEEGEAADLALLNSNVTAKEIPWPEQRNGNDDVSVSATTTAAAAASSSSSSSSGKHVTIKDDAPPAGTVDGGESG